jgi:hypothetical protein
MDTLSPAAREVLSTVAACPWSGPHRIIPLRRFTRLTPARFDSAIAELAQLGFVERAQHDLFWVTARGEAALGTLFDSPWPALPRAELATSS